MSVRNASDLTVVELKERLKELGLSYLGNKHDLITRLNASDPSGTWTEGPSTADDLEAADATARGRTVLVETQPEDHYHNDRALEAELTLLRQEVEILRRQVRPTVREADAHIEAEPRSIQPRINISAVAELLSTFDGAMGNFETWEKQLRLLKRTYRLDDEHTKILIGMRLKGKALEWLHSRPELIEVSVEALLCELKIMFDHRPSRITLRKKFEERVWKKGETFSDYVHQKIILGNGIQIDEDEIGEYIIDGIPDRILRDQARVSGLKTRSALLEAFERITLWDRKQPGASNSESKVQHRQRGNKSDGDGKSEQKKTSPGEKKHCFNCGLPDHLSRDCPTRESGPKCFKCGKRGHIAAKCNGKEAEIKDSYLATQVTQTKCNKEVAINDYKIDRKSVV